MSRKKMSLGFVVYWTFVMSAILEPRTPEGYLAQRHHKAGLFSLKLYCSVRTSFCSLSSWFVWSVVYLWSCFVWPVLFVRAVDVCASGQYSFGPVELDTYTDAFWNHDNRFLSEWFWFLTSCVSSVHLCLERFLEHDSYFLLLDIFPWIGIVQVVKIFWHSYTLTVLFSSLVVNIL